jgi:EamA domain-containing membrane protein RarD
MNKKFIVSKKSIMILNKSCRKVIQLSHFVYGINKIKSKLLHNRPEKEFIINRIHITILVSVFILLKKEKNVIVKSTRNVKWKTLLDNLCSSDFITQSTNWYQMLVQILTNTTESQQKQFFNKSRKLWSPALMDLLDMDSYIN